ncbi:MAG: alcohol dehydrogenase catalytic domain-containing protein, partial [Alphaproteobacteria bacterium]
MKMKAVYFNENGALDVLQYGELPDPVAAADEVVADIHAASVNGADWKVREGSYAPAAFFPYVCGRDFSGIVSEVGSDVTDLA